MTLWFSYYSPCLVGGDISFGTMTLYNKLTCWLLPLSTWLTFLFVFIVLVGLVFSSASNMVNNWVLTKMNFCAVAWVLTFEFWYEKVESRQSNTTAYTKYVSTSFVFFSFSSSSISLSLILFCHIIIWFHL